MLCAALKGSKFDTVPVYTGRYGLGSKDTTPGQIVAVYNNMETASKKRFTIGIDDDVTHLSLQVGREPRHHSRGHSSAASSGAWALTAPSAPTRTPSRSSATTPICTPRRYFAYDSKKSGGVTISHLRFGKKPIKSTYFVNKADFVACHNPAYVDQVRHG